MQTSKYNSDGTPRLRTTAREYIASHPELLRAVSTVVATTAPIRVESAVVPVPARATPALVATTAPVQMWDASLLRVKRPQQMRVTQ